MLLIVVLLFIVVVAVVSYGMLPAWVFYLLEAGEKQQGAFWVHFDLHAGNFSEKTNVHLRSLVMRIAGHPPVESLLSLCSPEVALNTHKKTGSSFLGTEVVIN